MELSLELQHNDNGDVIVCAGDTVMSSEIERVLAQHPAVSEVAVVARPDARWGEAPCAFVTLKASMLQTTAEDLIGFCRAQMTRFKVPKTVVFTDLPKTPSGNVRRMALRRQASTF